MSYKCENCIFILFFLKYITSKQIKRRVKALKIQSLATLIFNMFIIQKMIF